MFAINTENLKKKPEISHIKKTLNLSTVYSKYGHEYEKIFKKEGSIEIVKIFGLNNNIEEYQKIYIIMPEKVINQEFKLPKIEEIRNYLLREINQNELMSKKHKKFVVF